MSGLPANQFLVTRLNMLTGNPVPDSQEFTLHIGPLPEADRSLMPTARRAWGALSLRRVTRFTWTLKQHAPPWLHQDHPTNRVNANIHLGSRG
jgi:hypothetical protein